MISPILLKNSARLQDYLASVPKSPEMRAIFHDMRKAEKNLTRERFDFIQTCKLCKEKFNLKTDKFVKEK